MTDKDPKDMTASDLLRNTASSIETHQRSLEYLNMADSINLLREMFCVVENETSYSIDLANTLVAIADKIDAELSEARKDAIRESKKPMWWFRNAIKCGPSRETERSSATTCTAASSRAPASRTVSRCSSETRSTLTATPLTSTRR